MKMTRAGCIMAVLLPVSLAGFGGGVTDDAFKGLSADERILFVRSMNAMLPTFPAATHESLVETTYRLNRDFIKSTPAVDRRRVLAEVYATVPDYALPALTDGLSSKVFNRASMGFKKDDDSFQNFALSAMLGIYRRCQGDNGQMLSNQRRIAFAVIMFLKASEGDPEDLLDQLIAFVPEVARDLARDEWIPSAMGADGRKPTYEPIMNVSTNDVTVADAGIPDDDRRLTLKFPRSEQMMAKVTMAQGIGDSKLLLVPELDDDRDWIVRSAERKPVWDSRPHCHCSCPTPYGGQQY